MPNAPVASRPRCVRTRVLVDWFWLRRRCVRTDFGVLALLCTLVHGACHIARAAYESNAGSLVEGAVNRSGLVALLLLVVSVLPMSIELLRNKVTMFVVVVFVFFLRFVPGNDTLARSVFLVFRSPVLPRAGGTRAREKKVGCHTNKFAIRREIPCLPFLSSPVSYLSLSLSRSCRMHQERVGPVISAEIFYFLLHCMVCLLSLFFGCPPICMESGRERNGHVRNLGLILMRALGVPCSLTTPTLAHVRVPEAPAPLVHPLHGGHLLPREAAPDSRRRPLGVVPRRSALLHHPDDLLGQLAELQISRQGHPRPLRAPRVSSGRVPCSQRRTKYDGALFRGGGGALRGFIAL